MTVGATIWIVEGVTGEYDGRTEWQVRWCASSEDADRLRDLCEDEDASLTEDERDGYSIGATERRAAKLVSDPHWRNSYPPPRYYTYPLDRWPTVTPTEHDAFRKGDPEK